MSLIFDEMPDMFELYKLPYAILQVKNKEDFDQLQELIESKRKERLLILPCKIGDTVYCIYTGMSGKNHTIMQNVFDYSMIPFFGKSVFLNKEEAEAKLKELENNGLQ